MVKTFNQAIFILVCFGLGATLHEQETAQSGQFAQTSNNGLDFQFAFSRAGKKQNGQDFQPSHFHFAGCVFGWAQPSMNKRRLSQASLLTLPICFFPEWYRLSICFFPGWEKAKWSRLPTKPFSFWCVFGWARPSMNKRRLSQASLLRLPICLFPGREKAK